MPTMHFHRPLEPYGCRDLAAYLGDRPETTIPVHLLRRGLCNAYVVGNPKRPQAAVVQSAFLPGEPMGYGPNVEALWDILSTVGGWDCVDVTNDLVAPLSTQMGAALQCDVKTLADVYHVQAEPQPVIRHPDVFLMTKENVLLLHDAPLELRGVGFHNPDQMIQRGFAACGISKGSVVTIAHTTALTEKHADIGVYTLPRFRRRGMAKAAASIVANKVRESGRTPVWSCGEDNAASMAIAHGLGFQEHTRQTYLIPQRQP